MTTLIILGTLFLIALYIEIRQIIKHYKETDQLQQPEQKDPTKGMFKY